MAILFLFTKRRKLTIHITSFIVSSVHGRLVFSVPSTKINRHIYICTNISMHVTSFIVLNVHLYVCFNCSLVFLFAYYLHVLLFSFKEDWTQRKFLSLTRHRSFRLAGYIFAPRENALLVFTSLHNVSGPA
jgi:Ca2+/Na+ antiporter